MHNSLSVIVPNYNKANYLEQCLLSIEGQSFLPDEIIIVDDCSTDNSRDVIERLSKRFTNIKYLFLDKNGGVSHARNAGLSIAKGEYVTFIDSDDIYINSNKLLNEMNIIANSNGSHTVAYSVTITIDNNGNIINLKRNRRWKKREFVKGDSFVVLASMLKQNRVPRDYCINRKFLIDCGAYSYPKNFYEDLDLILRIAKFDADFQCTYQPGTGYRQVVGGLSSRTTKEHRNERKSITKHYYLQMSFRKKMLFCLYRFLYFFVHTSSELVEIFRIIKQRNTNKKNSSLEDLTINKSSKN